MEPHYHKWVGVVNKYLSSELIKMYYRFWDSSFFYWQQFHGWLFYTNYHCSLPWIGMCNINFMSKSPISAVKNYFLPNYQRYKAEKWPENWSSSLYGHLISRVDNSHSWVQNSLFFIFIFSMEFFRGKQWWLHCFFY